MVSEEANHKMRVKFSPSNARNTFKLSAELALRRARLALSHADVESLEKLGTSDKHLSVVMWDKSFEDTPVADWARTSTTMCFVELFLALEVVFKHAYQGARAYELTQTGPVDSKQAFADFGYRSEHALNYQKKSLDKKLNYLARVLGSGLATEKELRAVNSVRNCLMHRRGEVGAVDIKKSEDGALWLYAKRVRAYIESESGHRRMVKPDIEFSSKDMILTSIEAWNKGFKLGEQVMLSLQETYDIAFTLYLVVDELMNRISDCYRTKS